MPTAGTGSSLAPPPQELGGASGSSAPPRPGGLEAELFSEHVFRQVRGRLGVPDSFVDGGWSLEQLSPGGGKGGSLMARVGERYIVKELGRGDHTTLLELAESYGQHIESASLLAQIYLHFRVRESGRCFFAMQNGVGQGPFSEMYDLKGCADDKLLEKNGEQIRAVHKRIWNVGMWLTKSSWSEDRRRYFEGKRASRSADILVTASQRNRLHKCIARDTRWLMEQGIMDYSLLVAVRPGMPGMDADDCDPRCMVRRQKSGCVTTRICIIDFLQRWTAGKRVARCLKVLETDKATVPPSVYATRFASRMKERLQEVEETATMGFQKGTPVSALSTGCLGEPSPPVRPPSRSPSLEEEPEGTEPEGTEPAAAAGLPEPRLALSPGSPPGAAAEQVFDSPEPKDFAVSPASDGAESSPLAPLSAGAPLAAKANGAACPRVAPPAGALWREAARGPPRVSPRDGAAGPARPEAGKLHGEDRRGGGCRPGAGDPHHEAWDGLCVEEEMRGAGQNARSLASGGAPREIPKERLREPSPAPGWSCGFATCSCCGKPP